MLTFKDFRALNKISQPKLARKIGVKRSAIAKWEKSTCPIGHASMLQILICLRNVEGIFFYLNKKKELAWSLYSEHEHWALPEDGLRTPSNT